MAHAAPASPDQITLPDGRVELADPAVIADSPYGNAELAPTRHRWSRSRSSR